MIERIQVFCQACSGSGYFGNFPQRTLCPGCHGTGFQIMEVSFIQCSECQGTGRQKGREVWECRVCKGRGIVPLKYY